MKYSAGESVVKAQQLYIFVSIIPQKSITAAKKNKSIIYCQNPRNMEFYHNGKR